MNSSINPEGEWKVGSDIRVRRAKTEDLDAVKSLADANRIALGFVLRPSLAVSIQKGWLLVAERNGRIIGFIHYRHRKDAQTTVYQICVDQLWRGQGIGRTLMQTLLNESASMGQTVVRLKTPADIPANRFYQALGFQLIDTEPGRFRPVNVWEIRLEK